MNWDAFDRRPIVVALAGPNGAGKTTFYHVHLPTSGLPFLNADAMASELEVSPYKAAEVASAVRESLAARRESFIFETDLSDPVGERVEFLQRLAREGYEIIVCFIGLDDANQSAARVATRVRQGGHDVPDEKLVQRRPRTLKNLRLAIESLPHVLVFDNSSVAAPFRKVALFSQGRLLESFSPLPWWLPVESTG